MTSSLPLVSAVVTAYNYERYLGEALDSALAQDYPADRLEIIVVDDGSTDGTPDVARRYAAEHPGRIRYIRQDNSGLAAATTRGLQEARGELITLLDADDTWVTSRTRLLVDALERNPGAGLVYGDMEVIDGDGRTLARSWLTEAAQTPFRGRVVAHLLRSNFVIAPSLMFRAAFRDRVCPIPSFFPAQDWYIAARVADVAEVDFVPAVVARYRRHGGNMSNGKDTQTDIARLFRRDVGMRRWMLANLRSSELTVEDLADAYEYFWQTLLFVAHTEDVRIESVVEVTAADRRARGSRADRRRHCARAGRLRDRGRTFPRRAGGPSVQRPRPRRPGSRPAPADRPDAPRRRGARQVRLPPEARLCRSHRRRVRRRRRAGGRRDRPPPRCLRAGSGRRDPARGYEDHRPRRRRGRQARGARAGLRDPRRRLRPERRDRPPSIPGSHLARARPRRRRRATAHARTAPRVGGGVRERDRAPAQTRAPAREAARDPPFDRGARDLDAEPRHDLGT